MTAERRDTVDAIVDSRMVTAVARVTQIIGVPLGVACITWAAWSMVQMKTDMAVLTDRVSSLTAGLNSIYRTADAEKDLRLRDMRIEQLDRALTSFDNRLLKIERVETR